jgi:hypothetical protein
VKDSKVVGILVEDNMVLVRRMGVVGSMDALGMGRSMGCDHSSSC